MKLTPTAPAGPNDAPPAAFAAPIVGLADVLRQRTAALHRRAEQSGVVGAIIAGWASRAAYTLFLRNLTPVYAELERGLDRHRDTPGVSRLRKSELYRSAPLEHDLIGLVGSDWRESVPLLPEATLYADRIASAAEGDGSLLIPHAYTRYLGDLAGGPVLKRRLGSMIEFAGVSSAFYEFPGIADPTAFSGRYRADLDSAASEFDARAGIIEESIVAFQHNIDLSEAVQRLEGRTASLAGD